MRPNNKGFSLVELIVALAIFAIAGVAVFGFMVNSSNTYKRSNVELKLQYEQQLAVNQMRDMVVESDKGIYFDETNQTLALYGAQKSDDVNTVYPVTVIKYEAADEELYFGTKDFATISDAAYTQVTDLKLLAEGVTEFKVDLSNVKNDKVKFLVTFRVGDKTQTVTETVALRNRILVSNNTDTIWGDTPELIESFIKSISIGRGTKVFSNGEQDTIGKSGEYVVISYFAKVIANEESDREYAVSWSIDETINGIGVSEDGQVTVASTVPSSTLFTLRATSMDDPSKSAYIRIVVDDSGIYPESATLVVSSQTDGNGFRTYMLLPTLYYTDNSEVPDCNLFTWSGLDSLPDGCTFDEKTGKLVVTPDANGYTFTVRAMAKERKADGSALWADLVLEIKDVPEYVVGPTVKISCAKTLDRGGYVYPTMVFKNASHSNYTYSWKVEPYTDGETASFNDSAIDNSSFNLVSISHSGYNEGNVHHTMTTDASRRGITLSCSEKLNWGKTFKVLVTGTATDTEGNVIIATPAVVSINPVTVSITRFEGVVNGEDNNMPVITNSELMYEDWYWKGLTAGTDAAKEQYTTRRWFVPEAKNLYMTENNFYNIGLTLTPKFLYQDVNGMILDNNNVYGIDKYFYGDRMVCGFKIRLKEWENNSNARPAMVSYSIELKDNSGNIVNSDSDKFTVVYDFFTPPKE